MLWLLSIATFRVNPSTYTALYRQQPQHVEVFSVLNMCNLLVTNLFYVYHIHGRCTILSSHILHFTNKAISTMHKNNDCKKVEYLELPVINKNLSHIFQIYF